MSYIVVNSPRLYPEHIEKKNGEIKILDTYKNLDFLLSRFKGAQVRYNLMTRKREIVIPDHYVFEDDIENDSLARIEYLATINGMPDKQIDKFLNIIAGENPYHPIRDYIDQKPWQGFALLDDFLKTIVSTNPELDYLIIKTWMVAAVASAYSVTGFTNHGVLVIQGEQGIGKTEWVKNLVPINFGAVKTGALLEPKNKDSVIGLSRFWIVELGELDGTFNKTDIAHIKSFITASSDDVRMPYGRKETHIVRRTAYVATVNNANFLVDDTGNRRWWTVAAKEINYDHGFDMQQVWAEVKHEWDRGALTYLPKNLQLLVDENNKFHERIDPLRELLLTQYDWTTTRRRELTATEILIELGYLKPTQGERIRMGRILTDVNGKESRKSNGTKVNEVPERLIFGFSK